MIRFLTMNSGHRTLLTMVALALTAMLPVGAPSRGAAQSPMRVIEILADKDSRFKIGQRVNPTLTLKAGEEVQFRITAKKARTLNRNGSIHGFALIRKKDGAKFPDWDLELKPGTQEFVLKVPTEPGEYEIVCTVICSDGHEDMHMKVLVVA
jgi:heme/copper-type cytochrome/quinol oxidase subunit 2